MRSQDPTLPLHAHARVRTAQDFQLLEHARLSALVQRDMVLAWQLHAPDFHLVTPRGAVYTRESYLGEVADGLLTYYAWDPGPMMVRIYSTVALLRYQAQIVVDSGSVVRR